MSAKMFIMSNPKSTNPYYYKYMWFYKCLTESLTEEFIIENIEEIDWPALKQISILSYNRCRINLNFFMESILYDILEW